MKKVTRASRPGKQAGTAWLPSSFVDLNLDLDLDLNNETLASEIPLIEKLYTPKTLECPTTVLDQSFLSYEGPIAHSWPNDSYAKGSYSYVSPGLEEAMTTLEYFGDEKVKSLFVSIDNTLFFAGEHTSALRCSRHHGSRS